MRLYRSRENRILGGICGGIGDYLHIDPSLIRIFFIIFFIANGAGLFIYLLLWLILPQQGDIQGEERLSSATFGRRVEQVGQEFSQAVRHPNPQLWKITGIALVLAGAFFLVQALNPPWLRWFNTNLLWPLLLILGGFALLVRAVKGE